MLVPAAAHALGARELGVVVNTDDPQSIAVGVYYAEQRRIPPGNVVELALGAPRETLDPASFERAKRQLDEQLPPAVQALALTWTYPFRVGCMSVTSAFAFGYAPRYCAEGCKATAPNPYYDAASTRPWDDFRMRPAMLLAASSFANAEQLIDRGRRSDRTGARTPGRAYLVVTPERARSTRAPAFPAIRAALGDRLPIELVQAAGIRDRYDVRFYFTGIARVPWLETLGFLPGALADHLTSTGGVLNGEHQMSVLRWLEAGATASYGTVVEPCNFPQKFPNPAIAMRRYLDGETAIEAYWKSVAWPGQGLFVGEPLARPFGNGAAGDAAAE
ncbi:MAG: TIGR03790 family protein [Gammaproteobacteria bacterium]